MEKLSGFTQIVIFALVFSLLIAICVHLSARWNTSFGMLPVFTTYVFQVCANILAIIFALAAVLYLVLFRDENTIGKRICLIAIIVAFVWGWGTYLIKRDKVYLLQAQCILKTVQTDKGLLDKLILVNGARKAYMRSIELNINDRNCRSLSDFQKHIPVTIDRDYSLEKLVNMISGSYSFVKCKGTPDRSFTR